MQRLPADKNIVRWFPLDDLGQLAAQVFSGKIAFLPPGPTGLHRAALAACPFAEVGVAQLFQRAPAGTIRRAKLMIVDKRGKTSLHAVPDVENKRSLVKQLAVRVEEFVGEIVV